MSYDLNKIAKLKVLSELAQRIQARLNALETADAPIKSVAVVGNSLNFFTTTDTSSAAAFTVNLPAEISLDAETTNLISSFTFNASTYAGATDPNLNGKPVLVLGVKTKSNDGQTTTLSYSFIDVSALVDVYTASDTSIVISDNKVKANVSADSDNMLATTANGLKVDLSSKVDKTASTAGNVVTFAADGAVSDTGLVSTDVLTKKATATENNLVVFDLAGRITDTGVSVATNEEATEMLDAIFGTANISVSFSSTSDFFSTNAATFHNFLQAALNADSANNNDGDTPALSFMFSVNEGDLAATIDFTYGDIATLLADNTATFQNIVTLLNNRLNALEEPEEQVEITASFNEPTLTFTHSSATFEMSITYGVGETGNYILKSLYDNTSQQSAFEVENGDYVLTLTSA